MDFKAIRKEYAPNANDSKAAVVLMAAAAAIGLQDVAATIKRVSFRE